VGGQGWEEMRGGVDKFGRTPRDGKAKQDMAREGRGEGGQAPKLSSGAKDGDRIGDMEGHWQAKCRCTQLAIIGMPGFNIRPYSERVSLRHFADVACGFKLGP
jgi:hypothetical protein